VWKRARTPHSRRIVHVQIDFIKRSCAEPRNRWIYNIIDGNIPDSEIVILRTVDWTLTRDRAGADGKWLAVLHDTTVHSLRDLRTAHLPVLLALRLQAAQALRQHYGDDTLEFDMFVHYMPSTFQLHVHVHVPSIMNAVRIDDDSRMHSRRQRLSHVVRNLRADGQYYARCLLFANMCKTVKSSGVYTALATV
jgi:m7GpppX diphosphatase